jgi:hypothetical protein
VAPSFFIASIDATPLSIDASYYPSPIATMKSCLFHFQLLFLPVCILASSVFAQNPAKLDPTGTWQWTAKAHRNQKMQTTLDLQLQDGQLTGTISSQSGDVPISDSTFKDNIVAFSVASGDGTIKYSGMLSAGTIKGTVTFPGRNGGDPMTHNWNAKRVAKTPPPENK